MFDYILKLLKNDKGEVYASTAVKILIAVVLGSVLLVGLTSITKDTYLPRLQVEIDGGLDRTHLVDLEGANEAYASWRTRLDDKFKKDVYGEGYEFMSYALEKYAYEFDPNPTNTGCNIDNYIYCVYNINQKDKGKQTLTQSEFEHLKMTPEGKIEIMEVVNVDAY